jgi:hypothetical protein
MKFFSNKISVNGPSRSFHDIIQDVAGGMKKQASVVEDAADMTKEAKGKDLPDFIKEKIEERKSSKGKPAKKGKGAVPPEFAAKQKKADAADLVKVADVIKVSDDEVLLVIAEDASDSSPLEVDIEDDASDREVMEAMNAVAGQACGMSNDVVEGSGCAASSWSDKEASASPKFVKIANLTDKQKSQFRSYWANVWPKAFIDAVLETEN